MGVSWGVLVLVVALTLIIALAIIALAIYLKVIKPQSKHTDETHKNRNKKPNDNVAT